MVIKSLRIAVSLGLAAATVPATASNLIVDGSFETVAAPVGSYFNYSTGDTFSAWTVTGGTVSVIGADISCCGYSFPAGDGAQQLDLSGPGAAGANGVGGIQQTIATTAGNTYSLSFMVGNVSNTLGSLKTSVAVYLDGATDPFFTAVNDATTTNVQIWETSSTSFIARGTATTLRFVDIDPNGDDHAGLDNVVVEAASPAPESATWAMLVAGFGLVGGSMRRKRTAFRFA